MKELKTAKRVMWVAAIVLIFEIGLFLFFYGAKETGNKYDLNSDSKVDLQDVSILIYHLDK